jgi:hypothetical protein
MNLFDAQHKESKAKIKTMIDKMGLDEFIEFYISINEKINRVRLNRKDVETMIELTPKYMAFVLNAMNIELKRRGIDTNENL